MKLSYFQTAALNETPKEVLNWRLYWSTFVFGILGASRGLDEGLVGGMVSLKSFSSEFGMKVGTEDEQENRKSNITSMVQLGSIIGALLAFLLCDRIGRIRSLQSLCVLWLVGFVIVITSHGSVGQIIAGRFIAGLGIGMTVVVGPTYIGETAPRAVRGMLTNIFAGSVYLGVMIAYFSNWGASLHISNSSRMQWVAPQTAHIGFAGLFLIMSFTLNESPRYLVMRGKHDEAVKAITTLRQLPIEHPFVQEELAGIRDQLEREREATHGVSRIGKLRELVMVPANRYRLMLGLLSQLLGQWSGASAITIYAVDFFGVLGYTGQSEKLFATCILGVVKLTAAYLCAFFIVDFLGRRKSLYAGISLQAVSILYVAVFLGVRRAAVGAVSALYISGVGWAMGWNSFQYLVNADIWPLRLRALGASLVMCVHFVNQFGNTKAVPLMLLAMTPFGFFLFCSAVCLIGLAWVWFFVPEMAGRSLESMDELFALPWWKIGRHGHRLTGGDHPDAPRNLFAEEKVLDVEHEERAVEQHTRAS
ncbi:Major facilitator superfamily domain- general substrate transporter [Apiospora hydei]|uniref:Major facilitator superfamily domain- general substrate transporter n=1 Tax=Apiospora hydei TaxID=1337664 RepID=A0ABR1W7D9_9PEZI